LTPTQSAGIILLALAAWGGVHSLLASQGTKDLARRIFGSLADRGYRLGYNLFSGLSFLPVLALAAILPDRLLYIIPFPWFLLTTSLQAGAVLAVLAGLRQTGISSFLGLSQLFDSRQENQPPMVVEGLYHWVRHPLYTAGFVFIWLIPVMTLNLLALDIGMSAYLVIGAYFEERRLVREYGEKYLAYRQQTPMLIPRLAKKKSIVMDKEG
jgi:methanethiol S-methyltransferase